MELLEVVGAEDMRLVDAERPSPGPDEVLVSVAYCGICGSDFPRYFDGAVHAFPQTLGHEFSGTVVELGSEVGGIEVGAAVVVAPLVPCGNCEWCLKGRPALCTGYSFIGSRRQGALAEFVAVPAGNVVPLPAGVSLRRAALVEPLTVALHGIGLADLSRVERATVYGSGVIGLLTVASLRARGVRSITAVDVQEDKLELARRFGAEFAVHGSRVGEHFEEHEPPQLSIETAGHPVTQVQAVEYTSHAGQVVFVGTATRPVTFQPAQFERILRHELTLHGSWMSYSAPFPGAEWTEAVRLIASGAVDADALISRVYALDEGAQALRDVRDARGSLLKVLYRVGEAQ